MKKISEKFVTQDRWNSKGISTLASIEENPQKFIIDPSEFSTDMLDVINSLGNIKNKTILEYGSGRGEFSVALAKLGANVTGIDVGEDLIEVAKKIASLNDVKCRFIVDSIDKLSFNDNTFDFVIGKGILHHLPKKGVKKSLEEAYRVLKPGGMALFTEPIENSKTFDFIQNMVPIGNRPSILQRKKWEKHLDEADDRALSNQELLDCKGRFKEVKFKYYGFFIRLKRLFPNSTTQNFLVTLDSFLTHKRSPVKKLAQKVLVKYKK